MKEINQYLKNNGPYFAHIKDRHAETLEQHSGLVMDYFAKLLETNNTFSKIIKLYLNALGLGNKAVESMANHLFEQAIYLHDLGKININFQISKMKNFNWGSVGTEDSHHSIYSSLMYLHIFYEKITDSEFTRQEQRILIRLWVAFSYVMSRHHGYLSSLEHFEESLSSAIERAEKCPLLMGEYQGESHLIQNKLKLMNLVNKGLMGIESQESKTALLFWLLTKDLYSYIVTCDFYATGHYMSGKPIKSFGHVENLSDFTKKFYSNPLVKSIKEKNSETFAQQPINRLRTKMFHEAEKSYLRQKDGEVYYLEAPTGCGKTITSINLAVQIMETTKDIRRVFYVFPFNTLVEQTANVLHGLFQEKHIAVINSIESIKIDEAEDYNKSYLDRIMLHYPIVVTSHVKFFGALVGVSRESHLMFSHFKNSVVIIDEIQSYNNMIWQEMIEIIHLVSNLYNIKFVIMSATLPKISELIDAGGTMLLDDASTYYQNILFKNRTVPHFELLDRESFSLDVLCKEICEKINNGEERILVEFIDKVTARLFFELLKDKNPDEEYEIFELTGDDPNYYRQELIKRLQAQNQEKVFILSKVVVIATQVIEAGVDIDMFVGYKDVSIIDSEEQFAGRINRSCLKKHAPLYFFNLFDEKMIYKNDVRNSFSLKNKNAREWFCDKNYQIYFKEVMKKLKSEKKRFNQNSIQLFYDSIEKLDYIKVQKHLKLIDQDTITIFIPQKIKLNDLEINGESVWRAYIDLMENRALPYTEKQIKLSQMNRVFSYFTYSVKYAPIEYHESLGDRVFLLKCDQFIHEGKFNRQYYNEVNARGRLHPEDLIL